MEPIKDTIKQVMKRLKTKKRLARKEDLGTALKKVLTTQEKKHVKFSYFNKGVLALNVDSSSWLYHISLRKEKLINRLKKQTKTIKDIRFRIGETR